MKKLNLFNSITILALVAVLIGFSACTEEGPASLPTGMSNSGTVENLDLLVPLDNGIVMDYLSDATLDQTMTFDCDGTGDCDSTGKGNIDKDRGNKGGKGKGKRGGYDKRKGNKDGKGKFDKKKDQRKGRGMMIFKKLDLTEDQIVKMKEYMISHKDCMTAAWTNFKDAMKPIFDQAKLDREAIIAQLKAGDIDRKVAWEQLKVLNAAVREKIKASDAYAIFMDAKCACLDSFHANIESMLTPEQLVIWNECQAQHPNPCDEKVAE